jgi:pimeloyl-ACP methyl ester carboxylesterase
MTERIVETNGVELCTESFGDPADPPVLLVMGIGASMLWWEEGFCRKLADGRRFVIRYDHRDTGRSTTYPPGRPEYSGSDLVADAAGVLDSYGVAAAHLVGVSAGGGLAQLLALEFPDRVLSLVLISTSPATPGQRRLPSPTERYGEFLSTADVNWAEEASVIEYLVGYARMLAGGERPFDDAAMRELVRADVERAYDIAAAENHGIVAEGEVPRGSLSSIAASTLVIHGTADPMFPLGHGQALVEEIPNARLVTLAGAGHGLERGDWDTVALAIIEHTEGAAPKSR